MPSYNANPNPFCPLIDNYTPHPYTPHPASLVHETPSSMPSHPILPEMLDPLHKVSLYPPPLILNATPPILPDIQHPSAYCPTNCYLTCTLLLDPR